MQPPGIADIERAAAILAGVAVRTPLLPAVALTRRLGRPVFVKPEMLQVTGSFKFRGAYSFIARIPPGERARGVVAYSSGNFAQGLAAAGEALNIPVTIVMPIDAPEAKKRGAQSYGATVISTPESRVALLVVSTDEELMIARHTLRLISSQP